MARSALGTAQSDEDGLYGLDGPSRRARRAPSAAARARHQPRHARHRRAVFASARRLRQHVAAVVTLCGECVFADAAAGAAVTFGRLRFRGRHRSGQIRVELRPAAGRPSARPEKLRTAACPDAPAGSRRTSAAGRLDRRPRLHCDQQLQHERPITDRLRRRRRRRPRYPADIWWATGASDRRPVHRATGANQLPRPGRAARPLARWTGLTPPPHVQDREQAQRLTARKAAVLSGTPLQMGSLGEAKSGVNLRSDVSQPFRSGYGDLLRSPAAPQKPPPRHARADRHKSAGACRRGRRRRGPAGLGTWWRGPPPCAAPRLNQPAVA